MGKGDKRRKLPKKKELVPLAPVRKVNQWGKAREPKRDPRKDAMKARARIMGIPEGGDISAMAAQPLGDAAGQALVIFRGVDEGARLWGVWRALCGAVATYDRRILGKARFAQAPNLQVAPESFETRDDHEPDLRSEDERDADAQKAYSMWKAAIGRLPVACRTIIWHAVNEEYELVRCGALTARGREFVYAFQRLVEEMEL